MAKAWNVARRNLFILNIFPISDKILIICRELYFEVVGHVYLIKMGNFPENEMLSVKDQVGAADSFKRKTDHKKLNDISLVYS